MKKQNKKGGSKPLNKAGEELRKNLPFLKLIYISLFVNLLVLLFLFFFRGKIPPEVPLYYGFPEGESQLTNKSGLYLPAVVSIAVIVINSLITYFSRDEFIKKTLIIVSFAITFLSAITTVKIFFLVGSY